MTSILDHWPTIRVDVEAYGWFMLLLPLNIYWISQLDRKKVDAAALAALVAGATVFVWLRSASWGCVALITTLIAFEILHALRRIGDELAKFNETRLGQNVQAASEVGPTQLPSRKQSAPAAEKSSGTGPRRTA